VTGKHLDERRIVRRQIDMLVEQHRLCRRHHTSTMSASTLIGEGESAKVSSDDGVLELRLE
jgi:hypothetical protein